MANDKFFLAKKTDATLTADQVDDLKSIAEANAYTAATGTAVDDADDATGAYDDANNTEILADVAEIRTQLNALLASLRTLGVIATS